MPEHNNLHGHHHENLKYYTMSHLLPEILKINIQQAAILCLCVKHDHWLVRQSTVKDVPVRTMKA